MPEPVEFDVKSNKRILDVIRELDLPKDYYFDVKPHKEGNEWHEDIVAKKDDPETGNAIPPVIHVRRFCKSSILDSPAANVGPY